MEMEIRGESCSGYLVEWWAVGASMEPRSPALQVDSFPSQPPGNPCQEAAFMKSQAFY